MQMQQQQCALLQLSEAFRDCEQRCRKGIYTPCLIRCRPLVLRNQSLVFANPPSTTLTVSNSTLSSTMWRGLHQLSALLEPWSGLAPRPWSHRSDPFNQSAEGHLLVCFNCDRHGLRFSFEKIERKNSVMTGLC